MKNSIAIAIEQKIWHFFGALLFLYCLVEVGNAAALTRNHIKEDREDNPGKNLLTKHW